ncbi:MAG TPA: bifunctional aldolase/short-chain dehydrogenase [Gammaproteobacteria bacterium]|nr:bifunctional aldolase/short-chain dehydrogenase [Gammaproteobacteria bacterium]
MQNLWNDAEAAQYLGELGQRVYSSRLLGRDKSLVLHGGGNTSVKIRENNILGEAEDILYVKGSGWDLEFIEAGGFAPVRMPHLLRLAQLPSLSDPQMVNELRTHMTNAGAPTPSVEAILHAILPFKYVDHTHADAVVTLCNTPSGAQRIRDVYGDRVVIIPYIMPGFDLARLCADIFPRECTANTQGMVLMNHGIFSFGATAQESYTRMIELVDLAVCELKARKAWVVSWPPLETVAPSLRVDLAVLRREIAQTIGAPIILHNVRDAQTLGFARRDDVGVIAQQGPATPDHVIRTKRVPLLGRNVAAYAESYKTYFSAQAGADAKTMLDPAPRVILDPEFGLCTVGHSVQDAFIVRDIYQHSIDTVVRATQLERYQALPAQDYFDVEYWDLEQAKLRKAGMPPLFTGEVVLITGAASGIGKACVESFLARGAAVVGLDITASIADVSKKSAYLGLVCDVTDSAALEQALECAVQQFGGLDMLVLNAGVFPGGCAIAELADAEWTRVLQVNLDANLSLLRLAYPLLKLAPRNGRVAVIGSKNVTAPGPGAAAYSASKAALTQLLRVAALEWAGDGIRLNALHPDAVFDTGIWTDDVLAARAAHYGMSIDQYKRRNLLKTEITSHDVAELAAELCGPLFAKTTGAQIPIDGGDPRVI